MCISYLKTVDHLLLAFYSNYSKFERSIASYIFASQSLSME